jgi:hypothetical protein
VFNAAGKTDILIRAEDRSVFIAECKIWKGPATIRDALGQLLSYLSWRDTKAALLVHYKRTLRTGEDGERYNFIRRRAGTPARSCDSGTAGS